MRGVVTGIAFAAPLDDADRWFAKIASEVAVDDENVADVGSGPTIAPRKTAWYGDHRAVYSYANLTRYPLPWTPTLAALRAHIDAELGTALNACLVGVYENGTNSVGWHADDEPELRDRIVSVSLGATRTFWLRYGERGTPIAVPLEHGSVLVMTVESQRVWQHAVLDEPSAGKRINATFRTVVS